MSRCILELLLKSFIKQCVLEEIFWSRALHTTKVTLIKIIMLLNYLENNPHICYFHIAYL